MVAGVIHLVIIMIRKVGGRAKKGARRPSSAPCGWFDGCSIAGVKDRGLRAAHHYYSVLNARAHSGGEVGMIIIYTSYMV